MKTYFALFASGFILLKSTAVLAAVHYVDANSTSPTPPFSTWATAAINIQDAVDVASAGDEVVVTNGIYAAGGGVLSGTMTNRVSITNSIFVHSVNGPLPTVIQGYQVAGTTNGAGAIRCVWLGNGASLSGFTLTNGATSNMGIADNFYGGGAWCDATASVSNCAIVNNAANYGGGVYRGMLINCRIAANSAQGAGGAGNSTLVGCVVSNNTAIDAGGCGGCSVTNSVLSGNSAYGNGGAAGFGILTQCKILRNSAGVATYGATLESCLVAFNTGAGASGFMNGHEPDAVPVRNCTIISNVFGTRWCYVSNSIVSFNGQGGTNNYSSWPDYLWYCCTIPMPTNGFGCITNDPVFVDPANGNFRLQSESPCINAGDNSAVATGTDLDGNPRIRDGTVDIGAYEFQSGASSIAPPLAIVLSGQNATLNWPLWASNFVAQQADGLPTNSAGWSNVAATVSQTANENTVTVPSTNSAKFFRLFLP